MRHIIFLLAVICLCFGMLSACKRVKNDFLSEKEPAIEPFVLPDDSIEEIWQLEERWEFVHAMWIHVNELCNYGENINVLNHEQRVFYVTGLLEMEVNNGGFAQFFFNSSGAHSSEVVAAYKEIGAIQTAEICQKAIDVFDCEIPEDWDERLEAYNNLLNDEVGEVLMECDDAFYSIEEDRAVLIYQYILNNKESFS